MKRQEPIDPRTLRRLMPDWIDPAAREVSEHLRAFAVRYPDRFEFKNGKLQMKGKRSC